jgi:uncharacterized protein (TIGR00251 family)
VQIAYTATPTGISLCIHVSPGARRTAVGGTRGDALRVAVTAPAVEGRANAACVEALAAAFGVKRAAIDLHPAARGRRKRIVIQGDFAPLAARLAALAASA